MNKIIRVALTACILSIASLATNALAEGFENGDFSHGKSKWIGEGKIVFLKPDGSISPTDDSKSNDPLKPFGSLKPLDPQSADQQPQPTPIVEMKLRLTLSAELSQKFKTEKGAAAMNVVVVYKGSPDFKLNDKATNFTRSITWQAGSIWYWSAQVYPMVDLCIRLDKRDGHDYKLQAVKPGGDWQTAKFRWDNVGENQDVTLLIIAPPGHGTLWIKSVVVK